MSPLVACVWSASTADRFDSVGPGVHGARGGMPRKMPYDKGNVYISNDILKVIGPYNGEGIEGGIRSTY